MAWRLRGAGRRWSRVGSLAWVLLLLTGCEVWVGDRIATLPPDRQWQVLPLRKFLTRDTIAVDALEFCREESCGYDAAVGRFTASAEEAAALRQAITDPAKLARLVREPNQVGRAKAAKADIAVETFGANGWNGLRISIAGQKRRAYGVVLERPSGEKLSIILVFAGSGEVARMLALAAAG
jgi:hypothetical protein